MGPENGVHPRPEPELFPLGRTVGTPGALSSIPPLELLVALDRHASGDWGELCDEDREANAEALKHGLRLLSAYRTSEGIRFWIITEADRSSTTVLLPEEY